MEGNYKNAEEFANAHGDVDDIGEESMASIMKEVVTNELRRLTERVKFEIDPMNIWFEQSEREKYVFDVLKKISEADASRPAITTLPFQTLPKDKAKGLKAKFGLFAGDWNKFVEEIESGRVQYAEALLLDLQDAKNSGDSLGGRYYAKLADLNGNVLKDGVCVINYNRCGVYPDDQGGWIAPDAYMQRYPERTDEEFDAYEAAFWVNACQDPVDTSDRKHVYVLHFNFKGKDCYGVVYEDEFNDLKKIKDGVGGIQPENIFKYNNYSLDYTW